MRFLGVVFVILFALPTAAQERRALVIGNDAYSNVPKLEKAVADARAIAETFDGLGYQTVAATDANRREMNRHISEFTAQLEPGDTAVVFFAGHGVEIDGENYLLPTDIVAPNSGESDFVKSESIALSDLMDRVRAAGARMAILIIDACRDNPFEVATGRSIGRTRGLGRIVAPQGSFVIFSAGAGQRALDSLRTGDAAKNSVFTRALLPRLSQPGMELRGLVAELRVEVRDLALTVQHNQVPAYYDELLGEFYFTPAAATRPETSEPAPVAAQRASEDVMRADLALAREVGTVVAYDAFLDRYSERSGAYPYLVAQQLRAALSEDVAAPSEPTTKTGSDTPTAKALTPVTSLPWPKEEEPAQEQVETAAAPVAVAPTRTRSDIVRETQAALNALGCSAGGADGVIGPRTRSAFANFIESSGVGLSAGDLGTEAALVAIRKNNGTVCKKPPRPATASAAAPSGSSGASSTTTSARPAGPSLAGSWAFSARCALGVRVTGNVHYRKAGANYYRGTITDSLGQRASVETTLNGRSISGQAYFPTQTNHFAGQMAADGNSYTTSGTSTCKVRAFRTR